MGKNCEEFSVRGIVLDKQTDEPSVLLESRTRKKSFVCINVGPYEASSIILQMEGLKPPAPLAYDLVAQILSNHRMRLVSVEIYGLIEESYAARVTYRSTFRTHHLDIRPSDGIALAVRLGKPIIVSAEVVSYNQWTTSLVQDVANGADVLLLDPALAVSGLA
jgi:hypothetical protein